MQAQQEFGWGILGDTETREERIHKGEKFRGVQEEHDMTVYARARSFERGDVELGTRQESDRSESWNETLTVEFEYRNALRIALGSAISICRTLDGISGESHSN